MIKIITDSASGVSQQYADQHNITVVSLTTSLEGQTFVETTDQTMWDKFYELLKSSKEFPKTSQPTPDKFENAYNQALTQDPNNQVLVITMSQSLSGTYNAARLAATTCKNPNNVFVLDSGQTAASELLFLEEVVSLAESGTYTAKQIFEMREQIANRINIQFVPITMEYLRRGGRIHLLGATLANVLNIKPILSFTNGILENTKKCLGMQKAIQEMAKEVSDQFKKIVVCYVHEQNAWLEKLVAKLNQTFGLNIEAKLPVGPVVGSHLGVGTIGVAYIKNTPTPAN